MGMPDYELKTPTMDDFSYRPGIYQNDVDGNAILTIFSNYGILFPEGDTENPLFYFRHLNVDSVRWAGIIKLGKGFDAPQISAHHRDIAQAGDRVNPYGKLSEKPLVYGMRGIDKPFEIAYHEDGSVTWKEGENGSILNVKCTPFPYALFTHKTSIMRAPIWLQTAMSVEGTYEGKPVVGLGCHDRTFIAENATQDSLWAAGCTIYCCANYSGIREDGRKESFFAQLDVANKEKGIVFYYLEGEEPIVTDKVTLETEWHHLPYAPNDPTCVYKDATWRFADKEIHFHAKWGAKGFTEKPRMEKLGYSHCFGEWYEGKTPYKHIYENTFTENMEAIDKRIKEAGYVVHD